MASQKIKFSDWYSGINSNQQGKNGFQMMHCLDPFTRPGVLRVSPRMEADDDSAVVDVIKWFEVYDANGGTPALYGLDESKKLYYRTGGVWTLLHTNANSGGAQGLKRFNTSLYYTSYGRLGKLTGDPTVAGNYTDSHKNLKETISSGYNPMEVFAGALYILNDRYVAKLESDETTFEDEALTIAEGYKLQSVCVWNDYLVMGTSSTTAVAKEAVFFWDGVSDFPEKIVEVPKPGASALFNKNDTLYAFIGDAIYYYNGSEFKPHKKLPGTFDGVDTDSTEVNPGAVDLFEERMLFGTSHLSGTLGTAKNGIYSLGASTDEYPDILVRSFQLTAVEERRITIGAIKVFGTVNNRPTLYASYEDVVNGTFGVDVIDYDRRFRDEAYLVTLPFASDKDKGELIKGVKLRFGATLGGGVQVTVKYRIDENINPENDDSDWTTLGAITSTNQSEILYGIYSRIHELQLRLDFQSSSSTGEGPELLYVDIF